SAERRDRWSSPRAPIVPRCPIVAFPTLLPFPPVLPFPPLQPCRIPRVTERPPRPPRAEPREVQELKQIKATQPELASAVEMQLPLVEMPRRVQGRVPLPWIQTDPAWVAEQQRAGRPLVRFRDIPLEWSDFRLPFRQTADILRRHEALESV